MGKEHGKDFGRAIWTQSKGKAIFTIEWMLTAELPEKPLFCEHHCQNKTTFINKKMV